MHAPIRVSDALNVLYPESLRYVPDSALQRGTEHHRMMEQWILSCIRDEENADIPLAIRPIIQWAKAQGIQPHDWEGAEVRVEHQALGYIGHPDAIVDIKGKMHWLDWKFAESISEQNRVQGIAYTQASGLPGKFVQCKADGTVKAIACKHDPYLWAAFCSGLNVVKFHNRKVA